MKERDDGDGNDNGECRGTMAAMNEEAASSNDSYETINLVSMNDSQNSGGVVVDSSPEMMSPSMAEPPQLPSTTIVLHDGFEHDDDEEDDVADDDDSFKSIEIAYENESVEIGRTIDTYDDKKGDGQLDRSPSITSTVQTPPPLANRITISVKNILTDAAAAFPDNNRNNDDDIVPGGIDRRSPEFPHTTFDFVYDVVSRGSPSFNKNNEIVRFLILNLVFFF